MGNKMTNLARYCDCLQPLSKWNLSVQQLDALDYYQQKYQKQKSSEKQSQNLEQSQSKTKKQGNIMQKINQQKMRIKQIEIEELQAIPKHKKQTDQNDHHPSTYENIFDHRFQSQEHLNTQMTYQNTINNILQIEQNSEQQAKSSKQDLDSQQIVDKQMQNDFQIIDISKLAKQKHTPKKRSRKQVSFTNALNNQKFDQINPTFLIIQRQKEEQQASEFTVSENEQYFFDAEDQQEFQRKMYRENS